MAVSVCPAAVVAAPVENVWALLADPARYDRWWDARTFRIDPPGPAAPGQVVTAGAIKARWAPGVTLRVVAVNPDKHQIQFVVSLPFGMTNHQTTTCTPIDATSCRVQFG